MPVKQFSLLDQLLITIDNSIKTLFSQPIAHRPSPAADTPDSPLLPSQQKLSGALMRINHTGEVCAQALYYGQALASRSPKTKQAMLTSAQEETDHLAWCKTRLTELNDRPSYLDPLWYFGSFSIGMVVGAISDKWSLGFVVETERQVERHLRDHLARLPVDDKKSSEILKQMCEEEGYHATVAMGAGAIELPYLVKQIMKYMSKVMTNTAYYF